MKLKTIYKSTKLRVSKTLIKRNSPNKKDSNNKQVEDSSNTTTATTGDAGDDFISTGRNDYRQDESTASLPSSGSSSSGRSSSDSDQEDNHSIDDATSVESSAEKKSDRFSLSNLRVEETGKTEAGADSSSSSSSPASSSLTNRSSASPTGSSSSEPVVIEFSSEQQQGSNDDHDGTTCVKKLSFTEGEEQVERDSSKRMVLKDLFNFRPKKEEVKDKQVTNNGTNEQKSPTSVISKTNESYIAIQTCPSDVNDSMFAIELCPSHVDFNGVKLEGDTPTKHKKRYIDTTIGACLEVDYDINPTQIFLHIESNEWNETIALARSAPEQAATWVYRLDKLHKKQMWMMLPIHASIVAEAPIAVVRALLEAYPDGAKERDDKRRLPLHLTADSHDPDDEIIRLLLEAYPKASQKKPSRSLKTTECLTVVDYDKDCPPLYKLIEDGNWKHARRRVKYYPAEARKWVVSMKDTVSDDGAGASSSSIRRKRSMAIHAAVRGNAPKRIIELLINACPRSLKCVDDEGMIPLRLELEKAAAAKRGGEKKVNDDMVQLLLGATTYPEGIISFGDESSSSVLATEGAADGQQRVPELYKLIKQKDWNKVMNRVTTHPEEAQVWVQKLSSSSSLLWRHLPIHAALILKPPHFVIEALLTVYIDSVRCVDNKNLLPLQIALNNFGPDSEIVAILVDALEDPESISMEDTQGRTLLTNYDTSPTDLYQLIEEQDWMEVVKYLEMFGEEASTWVMRKHKDGTLRWRVLPLHAAINYGCPGFVVKALLDAYPEAIACVNSHGLTPFELARQLNAGRDVIGVLREAELTES